MPNITVNTDELINIRADVAAVQKRLLSDLRNIAAVQKSGRAGDAHKLVLDLIDWVETA